MAKISVMTGLTLPIPGQQYGMVKLEVRYTDIDTEGDVETQLKKCDEVALQTAERSEKTLAQTVADTTGLAVEGTGLAKEFVAFKEQAQTAIMKCAREIKRQKDVIENLTGQKAGKASKAEKPPKVDKPPKAEKAPKAEKQSEDAGGEDDPVEKKGKAKEKTEKRQPLRQRLQGEPEN